jgi:hypothetical protein
MGICQGEEIRRVLSDDDRVSRTTRTCAPTGGSPVSQCACRATASICLAASRTISIEHRTARLVRLGLVVDYLEHGRTFPTGAPTPAHDQTCYGLSIFLGKVRPFTSPRRGPSTGSDHCSRPMPDPFKLADATHMTLSIAAASTAIVVTRNDLPPQASAGT